MKSYHNDHKDLTDERCTPRPDKAEIADVMQQYGGAEGFSLEWIADRFPTHNGGRG